jgi:hypothetical protein
MSLAKPYTTSIKEVKKYFANVKPIDNYRTSIELKELVINSYGDSYEESYG